MHRGGYRYQELIDWFESEGLKTREQATRFMKLKQGGEIYLGQTRAMDEYYGEAQRQVRQRTETRREFFEGLAQIKKEKKSIFKFGFRKNGTPWKFNTRTKRFAKLTKTDRKRLARK